MDEKTLFLAVLPLVLIILGIEIFALVDLIRRDKRDVMGGNKWVWAAIILLINMVGPVLYLIVGRVDGGRD